MEIKKFTLQSILKNLIVFFIIVLTLTSCRQMPQETSSSYASNASDIVVVEEVIYENSSTEETSLIETTSELQTSSIQQNSSQLQQTESTSTISSQHTQSIEKSDVVVVQRADPETGISWDGVSPIVYTYPDGTTGTEKRDGATYEGLPGMITTYYIERDSAGRVIGSICTQCGKEIAHLSRGIYCKQVNCAEYCSECGVYFQPFTCHTCAHYDNNNKLYCTHCGKFGGDGTNGTCLRYFGGGNHICENCGEVVPENSCHACGQ